MTEIVFVLKAISTLMDSLKKTKPENGNCLNYFLRITDSAEKY